MQTPASEVPISLPHRQGSYSQKPKRLWLAIVLFVVTFLTCLAAGRQFAISFANGQAGSVDEFVVSMKLLYKDPTALASGIPFAIALMGILLAHELGHYFACKHHRIRASYPYFIPAPTLIGTLGAFILMRSPIRSRRALFDVGASGPLIGFAVAIPILIYGVVHSRVLPGINSGDADFVFGVPLVLRLLAHRFFPGADPLTILLHPVGRAAWVGLFATALNLLPAVGGLASACGSSCPRIFSLARLVDVGGNFAGAAFSAHSADL